MLGFCNVELNPFELVHTYVPPVPPPLAVNASVLPAQIGPLFEADAVGEALTVSVAVLEIIEEPHVPVTPTL